MKIVSALAFLVTVVVLPTISLSADVPDDQPNKYVEPTHDGRVIGRVYDAATSEPLQNAQVCIEESGAFLSAGRTTAVSDETGKYCCVARIGRISKNFNVGRALGSSLIGLLVGSATDTTKRIDISRLNVKAACNGYETFEGIVPVRTIDARAFAAEMHPILLTKAGCGEVPTSAPGWGAAGIVDIAISPSIARPGSKVSMAIRVKCPASALTKKTSIELTSTGFAHKWIGSPANRDGYAEFSTEYRISGKLKPGAELVRVRLHDCLAEIMPGGDYATALFQVVTTDEGEKTARLRENAYRLRQTDDNVEALGILKELCGFPGGTREDFAALAAVAESTGDYAASAAAWVRVAELSPEKERMPVQAQIADSLLKAGKQAQVISQFVPVIESVKQKDRPSRIPIGLLVSVGEAYLKENDIKKAADTATELARWRAAATDRAAIEFQTTVKLRQCEQVAQAEPTKAQAWADYGRLLLDNGRYEEALDKLNKANALDPNLSALQGDVQYAVSRLLGKEHDQDQDLDSLIQAAETRLGPKKESRDFQSWHNYALLLLRKAYIERATQPTIASVFDACKSALVSALLCGRPSKETIRSSTYTAMGYLGESVVGIEGFAYPEANTDFLILRSLRTVSAYPGNKVGHLNLAVAFIELQETDLAASAAQTCKEVGVDSSELTYVEALVAAQRGDKGMAKSLLRQVMKSNPRHPRANKLLAELYSEAGEQSSAITCLAAHANYYPKLRVPVEW